MSNKDLARRTEAEVFFDGVDISVSLSKYLLSLTYTDNEEDATDDIQIRIEDREGWATQGLILQFRRLRRGRLRQGRSTR